MKAWVGEANAHSEVRMSKSVVSGLVFVGHLLLVQW